MTASSRSWAVKRHCLPAEVSIYRRQFSKARPNAGGNTFLQSLNPNSLKVVTAYVEPSMAQVQSGQKFQFDRFGPLVADRLDHVAWSRPLFKRETDFKDS